MLSSTTRSEPAILTTAADELSQFFSGQRSEFSVPIKPKGTAFQLSVWRELQAIRGVDLLYRDIAERLGKPTGSRAWAEAVGRNPIPVIIPATASWVRAAPSPDFQVAYRTKNITGMRRVTCSNRASGIQIRDQLVFKALDSVTQRNFSFFMR